MRIDIVTIFPEMFEPVMSTSIVGLAREKGLLDFRTHDLRTWTHDRHRTTDDEPYGGGPGMVMKPEPVFEAVDALIAEPGPAPTVVFFTPAGRVFDQDLARDLASRERFIFVCGRYEGFDERALTLADLELSIGDYVLTGGELPAMVVADALARLQPGVLGDDASSVEESFSRGLLEYPHYTRPAEYRGLHVPAVLRSGNHAAIDAWRREQSVLKTARLRPELLVDADVTEHERTLPGVRLGHDDETVKGR